MVFTILIVVVGLILTAALLIAVILLFTEPEVAVSPFCSGVCLAPSRP